MPASYPRSRRRFLARVGRDNITLQNQQDSPLLRLPGEVRNKIYESLFSSSTVFIQAIEKRKPARGTRALLLTCVQVHKEARRFFWSCTTFNPDELCDFVEYHAGPKNSALIEHVTMNFCSANDCAEDSAHIGSIMHGSIALVREAVMEDVYEQASAFPIPLKALRRIEIVDCAGYSSKARKQLEENLKWYIAKEDLEVTFVD